MTLIDMRGDAVPEQPDYMARFVCGECGYDETALMGDHRVNHDAH